jgi:glycosyltransferase involved in cell wall biosynthesis
MNNKDRIPVTVAIPVKNEEVGLGACIERLGRFAEIVVIDSESTDRTREIARKFGARVVEFAWNGRYPKKRNWFLLNDPPLQPWVLFLDADEWVDDRFCDAVFRAVQDSRVSGYWLVYRNHFLGLPMHHGVAQRKLALFRVGSGLYERLDEDHWSRFDMEIHEHPIIEGSVGEILVPIDHRDDRGIARFLEKHIEYAKWEAKRFHELNSNRDIALNFTSRQRFKYRHLAKWWFPTFYFLFTYVVKRGFLDGSVGFHYAAYKSWYFRTVRLMILDQPPKKPDV